MPHRGPFTGGGQAWSDVGQRENPFNPTRNPMIMTTTRTWMAVVAVAAVGCGLHAAETPATPAARIQNPPAAAVVQANATNRFKIKGMHCDGCAKGISSEVRALKGVASVEVSFKTKLADVAYDTNRVTQAEVIRVISEAGYEATAVKAQKGVRP